MKIFRFGNIRYIIFLFTLSFLFLVPNLSIAAAFYSSFPAPKTVCLNVIVLQKDSNPAASESRIAEEIFEANRIWEKVGIQFTPFNISILQFTGSSDPKNDLWNITGDTPDEQAQKFGNLLKLNPNELTTNYNNACANVYYVNNIWFKYTEINQPKLQLGQGVTLDDCHVTQDERAGIVMARRVAINSNDIYGENPTDILSDTLSHELGHLLMCDNKHTNETLHNDTNILFSEPPIGIIRDSFNAEQICRAQTYEKLQDASLGVDYGPPAPFAFEMTTMSSTSETKTVTGRVLDNSNNPIEGALVSLFDRKGSLTPQKNLVTSVLTAKDGSFLIEGVNTGDYYLEIKEDGFNMLRNPLYCPVQQIELPLTYKM